MLTASEVVGIRLKEFTVITILGVDFKILHSCLWLSKLGSLFGSLLLYGTYYLGYPKRGP